MPRCELCDEQSWLEKMVGNVGSMQVPVDETMTCKNNEVCLVCKTVRSVELC